MEKEIKKKLVKNWFSDLQDLICYEVEEIENKSASFKINQWVKNKIVIPMIEKKRSLNLATSVAIVLSENLRQTNFIWNK